MMSGPTINSGLWIPDPLGDRSRPPPEVQASNSPTASPRRAQQKPGPGSPIRDLPPEPWAASPDLRSSARPCLSRRGPSCLPSPTSPCSCAPPCGSTAGGASARCRSRPCATPSTSSSAYAPRRPPRSPTTFPTRLSRTPYGRLVRLAGARRSHDSPPFFLAPHRHPDRVATLAVWPGRRLAVQHRRKSTPPPPLVEVDDHSVHPWPARCRLSLAARARFMRDQRTWVRTTLRVGVRCHMEWR